MVSRPFRLERWTNAGETTLASDASATDTTIEVDSAAAFPTNGDFRVLLDNSEEAIVKSVSGTTFTLTTGLTGSFSTGDTVVLAATSDGLADAFRQAWGAPTYPLNRILNQGVTAVSGDFTWLNQGSASVGNADDGGLNLIGPTSEAYDQLRGKYITAPSTPWTVTAFCQIGPGTARFQGSGTGSSMGIFLRESGTGELYYCLIRQDILGFWRMDDPATFSADVNSISLTNGLNKVWMQVSDTGTNVTAGVSYDGVNFHSPWSESRTAFMAGGPDQVGFGMMSGNGATNCLFHLKSWILE